MLHVYAISLIRKLTTEEEISKIYGENYLQQVLEVKNEYLEKN